MERFAHILFPVDFTPHCREVGPVVAAWARRFNAEVTLLHAMDMPPGAYADWYAFLNLMDLPLYEEHSRSHLERYMTQTFADVNVQRVLVEGPSSSKIVRYAHDHGVDLIMMPTRGLNKYRTLLLGSVTAHVLHDAMCPVWTEAHRESDLAPPLDCKSIVCAVDLSDSSSAILRSAKLLSDEFGAGLRVVHACGSDAASTGRAREKFEGFDRELAIGVDLELVPEPVAEGVCSAAASYHADLLVIGRGHLQGTLGRLRTAAHELIRRSSCPVLSV